jgi:hypothetical protein
LYRASLVGVYRMDNMPEDLWGFVRYEAARLKREWKKEDKVALVNIEGTSSFLPVFLDSLKSVVELEARLREQDAELTDASKRSFTRFIEEREAAK